ncbi:MAG: hypothetical protein NDJ89_15465 [Oligoflexia bacterium]|nr:hypothetical protein [Oligoflexia bacterium]
MGIKPAYSGAESSGGGGAFVCRGPSGEAIEVELVDLWEAERVHGLKIERSALPVERQLEAALKRLGTLNIPFAGDVEKALAKVQAGMVDLPQGTRISPPSDLHNPFLKPGCPLEGMMLYQDESEAVFVDRELFSRLGSNTDIAAALVHEAIYKVLRETQMTPETDSRRTRRIVGCLFAERGCLEEETVNSLLPRDMGSAGGGRVLRCRMPGSSRLPGDALSFFTFETVDKAGRPFRRFIITDVESRGAARLHGRYVVDAYPVGERRESGGVRKVYAKGYLSPVGLSRIGYQPFEVHVEHALFMSDYPRGEVFSVRFEIKDVFGRGFLFADLESVDGQKCAWVF